MGEGVFVESAFNMQCHMVKNTLLHIAFSAIVPAGLEYESNKARQYLEKDYKMLKTIKLEKSSLENDSLRTKKKEF